MISTIVLAVDGSGHARRAVDYGIDIASTYGAKLVIVNRDPTDFDTMADLVVHDEIGPTLGAAVGVD